MKTHYFIISFLALITLSASCKKEVDSQNPPNSSSAPLPVVFTANVNFIDENNSVTMNGVPDYDYPNNPGYTVETAGDITQDSILRLFFIDEVSQTTFVVSLAERGGDVIQPGTYSFANPTSDYHFAMQLENIQSDKLYTYMNAFNSSGEQYSGQPIIPNGTLTISSVNQTSISGTINAELYYSVNGLTNYTHKVTISNGSFSCGVLRY
jgi:hypothetical protein